MQANKSFVRSSIIKGEIFEFYLSGMAKNAFKFSTMVGAKFICLKLVKMPLNCPPWLEKTLKFICLKWVKMPLNCPTWLEKILKFICLKLVYKCL